MESVRSQNARASVCLLRTRFRVQEGFGDGGERRRLRELPLLPPHLLLQQRRDGVQAEPPGFILLHQRRLRPLREGAEDDHKGDEPPGAAARQQPDR